MIINIGKYKINDWEAFDVCGHLTSLRVCYDSSSSFGIYIYYDNNKWQIAIMGEKINCSSTEEFIRLINLKAFW